MYIACASCYAHHAIYLDIPLFTSNQPGAVLRTRFGSAARRASLAAASCLAWVCTMDRPPRRGLPRPNDHSHELTKGEAGILALGEHVRDCRSRVTSQKQRDKGDPAHHILDWSHVEAVCWGWFVQLHQPSVIHRPPACLYIKIRIYISRYVYISRYTWYIPWIYKYIHLYMKIYILYTMNIIVYCIFPRLILMLLYMNGISPLNFQCRAMSSDVLTI